MNTVYRSEATKMYEAYLEKMPTPIQVGEHIADRIPLELTLTRLQPNRENKNSPLQAQAVAFSPQQELSNENVVVFSVPKAFTPVCTNTHLPGIAAAVEAFKKLNAQVYCIAVNTRDELFAWQDSVDIILDQNDVDTSSHAVQMIPDHNTEIAHGCGMLINKTKGGLVPRNLGLIWPRSAIILISGVIRDVKVEDEPHQCSISSAQKTLARLGEHLKYPNANAWISEHKKALGECQDLVSTLHGLQKGRRKILEKESDYSLEQLPYLEDRLSGQCRENKQLQEQVQSLQAEISRGSEVLLKEGVLIDKKAFLHVLDTKQGLLEKKQYIEHIMTLQQDKIKSLTSPAEVK